MPTLTIDTLLRPFHYLLWRPPERRARMLLRFAEVEADGGHDLVRAAETTADPALRRRLLRHARDEQRHADLFRRRGVEILRGLPAHDGSAPPEWMAPGERGLDDIRPSQETAAGLLAFLHLSEKAAADDFAAYARVLGADPDTQAVFRRILQDEQFHMAYTRRELVRLSPERHGRVLWQARLRRLWRLYLRLAGRLAGLVGAVVLTVQYFLLVPPFSLLARRAAAAEPAGWRATPTGRGADLRRQY